MHLPDCPHPGWVAVARKRATTAAATAGLVCRRPARADSRAVPNRLATRVWRDWPGRPCRRDRKPGRVRNEPLPTPVLTVERRPVRTDADQSTIEGRTNAHLLSSRQRADSAPCASGFRRLQGRDQNLDQAVVAAETGAQTGGAAPATEHQQQVLGAEQKLTRAMSAASRLSPPTGPGSEGNPGRGPNQGHHSADRSPRQCRGRRRAWLHGKGGLWREAARPGREPRKRGRGSNAGKRQHSATFPSCRSSAFLPEPPMLAVGMGRCAVGSGTATGFGNQQSVGLTKGAGLA